MKRQETTMSSTRKLPSPDDAQYNLFDGVPTSTDASQLQTALNSGRRFVTGDARAIFLGPVRLDRMPRFFSMRPQQPHLGLMGRRKTFCDSLFRPVSDVGATRWEGMQTPSRGLFQCHVWRSI